MQGNGEGWDEKEQIKKKGSWGKKREEWAYVGNLSTCVMSTAMCSLVGPRWGGVGGGGVDMS